MKRNNTVDYGFIFIILIVLVIIVTTVVVAVRVRSDEIERFTNAGEEYRTMLVIHEEGRPLLTNVFFLNPSSSRGALFDIPGNTGTLIPSLQQVDRIDMAFDPTDPEEYMDLVSSLLGVEVHFRIILDAEGLRTMVDLVEGVEVFVPEGLQSVGEETQFLIPAGDVLLDGDKALAFLRYEDPEETTTEEVGRRHNLLQGLFRKMGEQRDYL